MVCFVCVCVCVCVVGVGVQAVPPRVVKGIDSELEKALGVKLPGVSVHSTAVHQKLNEIKRDVFAILHLRKVREVQDVEQADAVKDLDAALVRHERDRRRKGPHPAGVAANAVTPTAAAAAAAAAGPEVDSTGDQVMAAAPAVDAAVPVLDTVDQSAAPSGAADAPMTEGNDDVPEGL